MRAYRVYRELFADTAFSGVGARAYGGRWNSKGAAVVYTSAHLSLALLEIIVAADESELPSDFVYSDLQIPNDVRVERLSLDVLPARWYAVPAPPALREIGDAWVRSGASVALVVPSAVTRIEENVLLNPEHRDFARLSIGKAQPLPLDPRLPIANPINHAGRGRTSCRP